MLDEEVVKKNEFMFDKIKDHKRVKSCLDMYVNILQITHEQARYIITHNVTATTYVLMATNWAVEVVYDSREEWVMLLIKITLFRMPNEEDMFVPIGDKDKEILKKYYNLEL